MCLHKIVCSKERGENGGFCLTTANIATVDVDVGRIAGSNSICDVATTNCSTSEECSQAAANVSFKHYTYFSNMYCRILTEHALHIV